jgi:signal transduction histidine kinase
VAVPQEDPTSDEVLAALEEVTAALAGTERRAREIVERAKDQARLRAAGRSWRDITKSEDHPRTLDLLRETLAVLQRANSRYRRSLARELHDQGATMQSIAELFGITRQRVAVLLKGQEAEPEEA